MAIGRRMGGRFAITAILEAASFWDQKIDWTVAAEPSPCGERRVLTAFLERGRHFDAH